VIFWSSIVKKTSTIPNEMIHIMLGCALHLHDHWNKVMPLLKPSIFANLNNGAKFRSYTCWWLITLKATLYCIMLVTTTSTMKSWSSRVMKRATCNKTLDIKRIIVFSKQCVHFLEWKHTWRFGWHYVWPSVDLQTSNDLSAWQIYPTCVHPMCTLTPEILKAESNQNESTTLR
jgi:hypothetical protein